MKNCILLSMLLTAVILAMPQLATAQTTKLHKQTTSQGEIDRTPYVTYTEFQGSAVTGTSLSSKSSEGKVTLSDLLSVSSLDEVTRLFGAPEDLSRGTDPWDTVRARLDYKGMWMEYIKTSGSSSFRLRKMRLRSPAWSLTVNGVKLQPGVAADQLSPAVRQTMRESESSPNIAEGYLHIAKSGTAKNERVEFLGESTFIGIEVDKNTGTIRQVRFHRLL